MSSNKDTQTSLLMQSLASGVDSALKKSVGEGMGFMLIVFQSDSDGRSNYISNCERAEVIKALESLLQRWKEGMPDIPTHKRDARAAAKRHTE